MFGPVASGWYQLRKNLSFSTPDEKRFVLYATDRRLLDSNERVLPIFEDSPTFERVFSSRLQVLERLKTCFQKGTPLPGYHGDTAGVTKWTRQVLTLKVVQ